jgi:cytochrome P450
LLTPEFMLEHMRRLEPLILETVTNALDAMRDSEPPADLVASLSLPVPSTVIGHLLGVPYADHDFFQKRSQAFMSSATTIEDRRFPDLPLAVAADELTMRSHSIAFGPEQLPVTW